MAFADFAPAANIFIPQFDEKNWSLVFIFPFDGKHLPLTPVDLDDGAGPDQRPHGETGEELRPKLRTSIVEGVSVFLSLFDDNPKVKRVFCPKKECYDSQKNANNQFGKPLPSFSWLIENGAVCRAQFPNRHERRPCQGAGRHDEARFRARRAESRSENRSAPRTVFPAGLFLCDEYQHFATVGESDPTGDEKFFSLSRQPKCIPIIATQSISSLRSALPGESWRTLLQTFRTKIFLSLVGRFLGEDSERSLRTRRPAQSQLQPVRKRARHQGQPGSPAKPSRTRPTSSPRRATAPKATIAST
jgi:hypothetical protein